MELVGYCQPASLSIPQSGWDKLSSKFNLKTLRGFFSLTLLYMYVVLVPLLSLYSVYAAHCVVYITMFNAI